MNNAGYWKKRIEQKLNTQYKKADTLEQDLKEQYEKALIEINKQISNFYMMFAKDNEMTYVEAIQQLRGKEFRRWRKTIDDYIREIETMEDKQLLLELNTLAMKSRINRLDSLMVDIQMEFSKLYGYEQLGVKGLLEDVLEDTYYQTIYEVQVGRGIGHAFGKLDNKTVEDILNYPWSGDNYSNRIWKQKDKLVDTIKQELTQKFIQGKDVKTTARAVAEKMNVSYRNAATLVQTETSYIIGEATARGYAVTNVEKYEILATLDIHTSDICRKEDGEVYDLKDKKIGVNYPPFHIRCRTTTVPYFEDDVGERAARDPIAGKAYYVPSNMKYEDWYDKYVKEKYSNGLNNDNKEVKIQNKTLEHASRGKFTNPRNPKKQAIGNFKGGGHGQDNINLLQKHGIEYNIVKEYPNGIRCGNVPSHKEKEKKSGTGQSWFPKNWTEKDIERAGEYVANLKNKMEYMIQEFVDSKTNKVTAIYKFANYRGVTVGICYNFNLKRVTTIFPDQKQRLLGGE